MKGSAVAGSAGETDNQVEVLVRLDEELMVAIHQECELMEDGDIGQTIRRRLTEGLVMAIVMGAKELVWRPIHRDSATLAVSVPAPVHEELGHCVETFGYDRDVLIATILSNSICKPMAVVARETRSYAVSPFAGAAQIRREPGRGNIYPVQFFLPGYQLVFVRMLAGAFSTRRRSSRRPCWPWPSKSCAAISFEARRLAKMLRPSLGEWWRCLVRASHLPTRPLGDVGGRVCCSNI